MTSHDLSFRNETTDLRKSSTDRSRRHFLKGSLLAGAALTATGPKHVHAAGSETIRFGLIGCGGRGTGAASNALTAAKDARMVAMADLFETPLKNSRLMLEKKHPDQFEVPEENQFVGFDAYKQLLECDIDVVLIAAASHFHPLHLKLAIEKGKHVFCEKPHGLDAPALKITADACKEAEKKKLNVVSGLCWRYDDGVRETMLRVLDGAIGEITAIEETYITAPYILRPREPQWSEIEYQFRNWYHFNWLSGDQTGQQLIHSLDKGSWAMGDIPPVAAWGLGGRQVCKAPKYGDQFDHHSVVFEYENGVHMYGFCRAIPGCYNTTRDIIHGSKGRAYLPRNCRIEGDNAWEYKPKGKKTSMYENEQRELFDAVRSGRVINNSDYMYTSTMLGVLAQRVCYTGSRITWDEAVSCPETFLKPEYHWQMEPPVTPGPDGLYPSPLPGIPS